jgi:hypothetical protein
MSINRSADVGATKRQLIVRVSQMPANGLNARGIQTPIGDLVPIAVKVCSPSGAIRTSPVPML